MAPGDAPHPLAQTLGVALVLASFSFNSLATRWIVVGDHLDPGMVALVRFVAGAAMLVVIALVSGRRQAVLPRRRWVWPAFWLGAYALLISYGYRFIGAAAGTFVFFAAVLVTMSGAEAVRGRRLPAASSLAGAALALAGLSLLAVGDVATVTWLGLALMVGTGVSWGAYSVLGKRAGDPLTRTVGPFVTLGVVLVVPLVVALGGDWLVPVTARGLLVAALMGAVPTGIAYAFWSWMLPHLTGTQAGVYQMFVPVLTGLAAVAFLGEAASVTLVIAGACVVAGMALATPRKRRLTG